MTLKIDNVEHFHTTLKAIEAATGGDVLLEALEGALSYLHHYGENLTVSLGYDFSQWGFSVLWTRSDGSFFMNGLLHYCNGEWSVHT